MIFVSLKWRITVVLLIVSLFAGVLQTWTIKQSLAKLIEDQRAASARRLADMLSASYAQWATAAEQIAAIVGAMQELSTGRAPDIQQMLVRHGPIMQLDIGVEALEVWDSQQKTLANWGHTANNLIALKAVAKTVITTLRPKTMIECMGFQCIHYTIVPARLADGVGALAVGIDLAAFLHGLQSASGVSTRLASPRMPLARGSYRIEAAEQAMGLPSNVAIVATFDIREDEVAVNKIRTRLGMLALATAVLLGVAVVAALWRPLTRLRRVADKTTLIGSREFERARIALSSGTSPRFKDEIDVLNDTIVGIANNLEILEKVEAEAEHATRERIIARRLSSESARLIETEKRRIGRELHDELGQMIVTSIFEARQVAKTCSGEARETAQRLIEKLESMYKGVNVLIDKLRPELLDTLGLESSIRSVLQDWRAALPQCRFSLQVQGQLDHLESELKVTIYRIIQESLTNTAKHADATAVTIQIKIGTAESEDVVRVEVADNGSGFDPEERPGGIGLKGMAQRVAALGGKMDVKSQRGKGTRIIVRLPLTS